MKNMILAILFFTLPLNAVDKPQPPSVLIIGAGPAGLATAIQARRQGYAVTLVEKRDAYTRSQTLFLLDTSLELLEKWGVAIPEMKTMQISEEMRLGWVQIKHLETRLEKKALELGTHKIYGEFHGLKNPQHALIELEKNKEIHISYDIIIAADGTHSRLREALGIETHRLGTASGAFTFTPLPKEAPPRIDISQAIKIEDGFLRRIKLPTVSIVFIQTNTSASKKDLEVALQAQKWTEEADAVSIGKASIVDQLPIYLQRASAFSDEGQAAILVGDAAATASFFQGMGANTALKTADIAGQFFKDMHTNKKEAYTHFNLSMKEAASALIEDSVFLFQTEERE